MKPERVFAAIQDRPGAVWLDGGRSSWSILAWDPADVVTSVKGWMSTARRWTQNRNATPDVPFASGCIGYLGYEVRHKELGLPLQAPTPEPPLWLGRYEGALCYRDGRWHTGGSKGFQRDARQLLQGLEPLDALGEPSPHEPPQDAKQRAMYREAVEQIRGWIAQGDCYQINMTRTVAGLKSPDPWRVYRRLRRSDASFGAFLRIRPDLAVLCNSPELLLRGEGSQVYSEPIKGTRARAADPSEDLARRDALMGSRKDQSELTMIVDLVRNDLGRIASPGSVSAAARAVTGHANVWHTSQCVSADVDPRHDAWDTLTSLLPPGSVTGAPKRRACQRIAELEASPRGVYCGSIGYASDHGTASWNVAIRTAVWHQGQARYHVGGGIVFDSNPDDEWQETVDKSTELHRAFHAG